jgi:hypothetical protein
MTATIIVLDEKSIEGSENGFFLDLIDVLRVLPQKCHGLSWFAFDLWIEPDPDDPHDLAELTLMSKSAPGARMTWDELWAFAELDEQVIEGQFIGYQPDGDPPNVPDRNAPEDTKFAENCAAFEIVLEAIDSSLWQICSKDAAMIEELSGRFKDVEGPA